jgi:hypothetical protein
MGDVSAIKSMNICNFLTKELCSSLIVVDAFCAWN